jgi:hypothetical protein
MKWMDGCIDGVVGCVYICSLFLHAFQSEKLQFILTRLHDI